MTTPATDHPFFARLWIAMSAHETALMTRLRRENLEGLSGRVLEVGAGTGTNFAFYPDTVTEVVAVEPERRLAEHARTAAEAVPVPVEVHEHTAENLGVPGESDPFDAVVCSLVLCSIDDAEAVLRQLYSMLRPGGELRFLEHVASPGMRGRLQAAVDATFWPRLFGNCHTHRDAEGAIKDAGFAMLTDRHQWTMPRWVPLPVSEFALGRAVRPGQPAPS